MKKVYLLITLFICTFSYANNDKYRLILNSDPSTTMMVAWNQISGTSPTVYYDTVDHGNSDHNLYSFSKTVDRSTSYKGMENQFANLTGLTPDTNYYFIIHDSEGNSSRFWFRTAPSDLSRLSFIAGGDSRNHRTPRQAANLLVSKLKPHAVIFGGDMTSGSTDTEWQNWMDDWQLTTASNGRMFPIIPARGNHENENNIYNLFNTTSDNESYYAITFGDDLFRIYTLNSEISVSGNQLTWLTSDIAASTDVIWKSAQYHRPMRPHYTGKAEGVDRYNAWAQLFFDNEVRLVMESDTHTVKTTWPIEPSSGSGNDEGFIRNDNNGTVYIGEGCWGAPTRAADDGKDWTRNMGQFNQFKLIFVSETEIEIRTIEVDNAASVGENSDNDSFTLPSNLSVWNPSEGDLVTIYPPDAPKIKFADGTPNGYVDGTDISLDIEVTEEVGGIAKIEFYVDGTLISTDTTAPYNFTKTYAEGESYDVYAKVTDNDDRIGAARIAINVGTIIVSNSIPIATGDDDVEETESGRVYFDSTDLEMVYDSRVTFDGVSNGYQKVGFRFLNIDIPKGAIISSAYIQFRSDEINSVDAELSISAEDIGSAPAFEDNTNYNISSRNKVPVSVTWNPANWTSTGQTGTAQRTSSLTTLLQKVIEGSDWAEGNDSVFIIEGSGVSLLDTGAKRVGDSYEGSSTFPPTLVYTYSLDPNIETISSSVSIAAGDDDVEETETGRVYFTSSDLEMTYDAHAQFDGVANGYQKIGLRFQDIEIPFGAELTSAYVQFSSDRENSVDSEFLIYAENSDDAVSFVDNTNLNVSSRNKVATSISWVPNEWMNDQKSTDQRTPNLSAMLQDVVDRCNWRSGNSMVIIIEGDGESLTNTDSKRIGDSFEEGGSNAPKLYYTYNYNTSINYDNETVFNGTWSNGTPTSASVVKISEDYNTTSLGSIDACTCEIETGKELKITANKYINIKSDILVNGSLVIEHEGSVVQQDENGLVTNNGNINVEKISQSFTDRGFSILGSPMTGETSEGVYTNAYLVRYHDTDLFVPNQDVENDFPLAENFADDNGDNWINHTGALIVGEGYLVKPYAIGEAGGIYTTNYTQGTLNNGIVNFSAKFGDDQNDSPNILSNPYASAVDGFKFITDNAIVDAIYYWEHIEDPTVSYPGYSPSNYQMGDISMYNLSGGVAATNSGGGIQSTNQYIPSGQGFAIKANAAGTVTFDNSMRVTGNNNGYRNSETAAIDRLYLSIKNNTYDLKSGTLIAFTELATDGYDKSYDAKRIATPVSLYSLNSDKELGIQGRSAFNENHILYLGFSTQIEENQEYTISISSIEGELISNATVYLKDNVLNTLTNLSETDYSFTSNEGHQNNRFALVFTEDNLGTQNLEINTISIFPNPTQNILNIISPQEDIINIEVYDVRGRKINNIDYNTNNYSQVDLSNLKSALYFIKIYTESESITKKVVKR